MTTIEPVGALETGAVRSRILGSAFRAFQDKGYAGVSMLEIATRARISKRDLYAHFPSKQAVLVACILSRSATLGERPDLPAPRTRAMLQTVLTALGTRMVTTISSPTVVAMFQLAIAEARRSPEVAEALDANGRKAARQVLIGLIVQAQTSGLIGPGEPGDMASQFWGLLWEGLMVSLVMGLAEPPAAETIHVRASRAAEAFLKLHPIGDSGPPETGTP